MAAASAPGLNGATVGSAQQDGAEQPLQEGKSRCAAVIPKAGCDKRWQELVWLGGAVGMGVAEQGRGSTEECHLQDTGRGQS